MLHIRMLVLLLAVLIPTAVFGQEKNETDTQTTANARTPNQEATGQDQGKAEVKKAKTLRVAIFIKNRSKDVLDEKLDAFEDLVTANVTEKGYQVISREDVVQAVSQAYKVPPKTEAAGRTLDAELENSTTAVRLAQNLNAQAILSASLISVGHEKETYNRGDIHREKHTYTLRVTYKLLDLMNGASVIAGTVQAVKTVPQSPGSTTSIDDMIDQLLNLAAKNLADKIPEPPTDDIVDPDKHPTVKIQIACGMADLSIPEIVKNDKGEYIVTANRYKLEPMNVTVEMDGLMIGTAPGSFTVAKGLHRLRLTRALMEPIEKNANFVRDGQVLQFSMAFTEEGLRRWRANTKFLNDLKANTILTAAQAKLIEAVADSMKQDKVKGVPEKNTTKSDETSSENKIDADVVWP